MVEALGVAGDQGGRAFVLVVDDDDIFSRAIALKLEEDWAPNHDDTARRIRA